MTSPRPDALHMRLTDSTLRDGSHAVAHQFTEAQVRGVVHALDASNVEVIEVSHGDGLGGSSFNYGFSREAEFDLIAAAVDEATRAKIAVLLLPGVGTIEDLRQARDVGASVARIATHCTEADVSLQHFGAARDLGMETVGFLMLAHRIGPAELARQARIMVDAGAECVYVVDSAGALILADAQARVAALVDEIGADAAGRLPRAPEPVPGRGQQRAGRARRRPPGRRRAVRAGRGRRQRAHRGARGDLRQARHQHRHRRPRRARGRRRGAQARPSAGCRSRTGPRSSRVTPASTAASCCTPSGRPSATASPPTRSCRRSARPATSAARKT